MAFKTLLIYDKSQDPTQENKNYSVFEKRNESVCPTGAAFSRDACLRQARRAMEARHFSVPLPPEEPSSQGTRPGNGTERG